MELLYMRNALKNEEVSSVPRLKEAIKTLWTTNLSEDYFTSLGNVMPLPMQDVINAGENVINSVEVKQFLTLFLSMWSTFPKPE